MLIIKTTKKYRLIALCIITGVMNHAVFWGQNVPVTPPPPPTGGPDAPNGFGVPIDDNVIVVMIAALIFGTYMVYRYNQKQKIQN